MISQRVLCFLERDGRYLLLHRRRPPNAGMWNAVGGKMEPGEDPYAACIREVREETGLAIAGPLLRVLLVVTVRRTGDLWVIYVFRAAAPPGAVVASDEGELRWVSVGDLPALQAPEDLPVILPRLLQPEDSSAGGVAVVRLDYETEDGHPIRTEVLDPEGRAR
jgi:8-oxo-dGTP pyrophosphatase MutT (NUDIX family)